MAKATILLIDDEPNILKALKRLLRREGYDVLTRTNGEEAIDHLRENSVDLIICDQRMPGMNGADTLEQAVQLCPEAIRITLTGYTDLQAAQDSINKGKVQYFLTKPWDDDHLRSTVQSALKTKSLERANSKLRSDVESANHELMRLNSKLEERVRARTAEVEVRNRALLKLNRQLEQSCEDTIAMYSTILAAMSPEIGARCRRVSKLAFEFARIRNLPRPTCRQIRIAAMLWGAGESYVNLGQIGGSPIVTGGAKDLEQRRADDATAGLLRQVQGFETIAEAIQSLQKPWSSRSAQSNEIASMVSICLIFDQALTDESNIDVVYPIRALQRVKQLSGKYYTSELSEEFVSFIEQRFENGHIEVDVTAGQLKAGMTVVRNIYDASSALLVCAGTVLDAESVETINIRNKNVPVVGMIRILGTVAGEPDDDQNWDSNETTTQPHILVVDDDVKIASAVKRVLRRYGYQVDVVDGGKPALQEVLRGSCHLVITDLMMPGMSGIELIDRLAQAHVNIPCIVLTANATRHNLEELKGYANISNIIVKPWDDAHLIEAVRNAIKRNQAA